MNSCAISQSLDAILISGLVAAGLEFTMNKVRSDLRKIVHLLAGAEARSFSQRFR
jgi:hypothetical protein